MNQPGFTAEAALYKTGVHQLMAVWTADTDGRIHSSATADLRAMSSRPK